MTMTLAGEVFSIALIKAVGNAGNGRLFLCSQPVCWQRVDNHRRRSERHCHIKTDAGFEIDEQMKVTVKIKASAILIATKA